MGVQDYLVIREAVRRLAMPAEREANANFLLTCGSAALAPLLRALESTDPELVYAATQVLGRLGDPKAVTALGHLLTGSASRLAAAAAEALGNLEHPATLALLARGLQAERKEVRVECALSLARLATQSSDVGLAAAATLAQVAPGDVAACAQAALARSPLAVQRALFAALWQQDAQATGHALLAALEQRALAAAARAMLACPPGIATLLAHLDSANASRLLPVLAESIPRLQAVWETAQEEPVSAALRSVAAALYPLAYGEDAQVRAETLRVYRALGPWALFDLAARLSQARGPRMRPVAVLLRDLGWHPGNDETAARYWLALDRWDMVRQIGQAALPALVEEFEGLDLNRRDIAAQLLRDLDWLPADVASGQEVLIATRQWQPFSVAGSNAVPALMAALRREWQAIARVGPDARASARAEIVRAIAMLDDETALMALVEVLRTEPTLAVRTLAAELLALAGMAALPALVEALTHELRLAALGNPRRGEGLRSDLVALLARLPVADAVEALMSALTQDPSSAVRAAALSALTALAKADRELCLRFVWPALDGRLTAEFATLLARLGDSFAQQLAALLSSADERQCHRAETGLVAMAQGGYAVETVLDEALTTSSAQARRAASVVCDRLGYMPSTVPAQVAYWVATGRCERAEPLGAQAISPLQQALQVYDWHTASVVALSLVRLGCSTREPAIVEVLQRLNTVAALPDEHVARALDVSAVPASSPEIIRLRVTHQADRKLAQRLLAEIQSASENHASSPDAPSGY